MRIPLIPRSALAAVVLALGDCKDDATGPTAKPPYLALVSLFAERPEPDVEAQFGYRVQDIGGATALDTTIRTTTADTVILPLPVSTYRVTLVGLPTRCVSREGAQQNVPLANIKGFNTNIARYHISCQTALNVTAYSFGPNDDNGFIYTLRRDGSSEQLGSLPADTALYFTSLEPGWYTLTLGHVSEHCVVISDGGLTQRFEIPPTGGMSRVFSVSCSDPARRPTLLSLRGSYHDHTVAMVMRATDPDDDIVKFFWDVTDCAGTSLRPGGPAETFGLVPQRRLADTVTFLVANEELGIPDAEIEGRCVAARIADDRGNTTPWVQSQIRETGQRPVATLFNAVVITQQVHRVTLEASDPDDDFAGTFVARRIRDGVRRPADGKDDFLYANFEGYLSTSIPDLPLQPMDARYPTYLDVNAVIVYLIDARGNFSRYVDEDTFH